MTTNTTYHNNPLLKSEIVKQMADHVRADTLIKGSTGMKRRKKGATSDVYYIPTTLHCSPSDWGCPYGWLIFTIRCTRD
jgi:hypothetical protein